MSEMIEHTAEFWRTLLVKYISHVGECEGITFIHRPALGHGPGRGLPWTDEEYYALCNAEAETAT